MDIMMTGEDQSQADQPNSLAEGPHIQTSSCVRPFEFLELCVRLLPEQAKAGRLKGTPDPAHFKEMYPRSNVAHQLNHHKSLPGHASIKQVFETEAGTELACRCITVVQLSLLHDLEQKQKEGCTDHKATACIKGGLPKQQASRAFTKADAYSQQLLGQNRQSFTQRAWMHGAD
eukprot:514204-Pelagomonas_calceolata.AAC.1